MKKKKMIAIILFIIMFLLILYLAIGKNIKSKIFFGNEYCSNYDEDGKILSIDKMHAISSDEAIHVCVTCLKVYEDSSGCVDLCEVCAEKTNRCNVCGGIIPKE